MGQILTLPTAPTAEAVPLADLKAHLQITHTMDDARLADLAAEATVWVEEMTGRALVDQTWVLWFPAWPAALTAGMALPRMPLDSVTHVKYYDPAGVLQTLASSNYSVLAPSASAGLIVLTPTAVLPTTQARLDAIAITFKAGYGPDAGSVPAGLRYAVCERVRQMYDGNPDDAAVMAALTPYRVPVVA